MEEYLIQQRLNSLIKKFKFIKNQINKYKYKID